MSDGSTRMNGVVVPKVKRPKKGWFVPRKRRPRQGPRVKPNVKGLPPCPACGQWSMQKDSTRRELYCGSCGAIM